MDLDAEVIKKNTEEAYQWIVANQKSVNECIHDYFTIEERNPTVQALIAVGKDRSRTIHGALPYGVGRLKTNLIDELALTPEAATAVVARLKADERLYQVGRGLGKMLVLYSGPPKNIDGVVAAGPPGGGEMFVVQGQAQNNWAAAFKVADHEFFQNPPLKKVAIDDNEESNLSPRLQKWFQTVQPPPRKAVRKANNKPVELEKPAIVDYGDLQEIYNKFSTLFEELKAKCDELKEENMVLNQATWQS